MKSCVEVYANIKPLGKRLKCLQILLITEEGGYSGANSPLDPERWLVLVFVFVCLFGFGFSR